MYTKISFVETFYHLWKGCLIAARFGDEIGVSFAPGRVREIGKIIWPATAEISLNSVDIVGIVEIAVRLPVGRIWVSRSVVLEDCLVELLQIILIVIKNFIYKLL